MSQLQEPQGVRALLPDEQQPEAHQPPQTFYEVGEHAGTPADGSTKVGWTLRDSRGAIANDSAGRPYAFAFLINPQGLTRVLGSRAQLFSTQGAHYVDDFGPAAEQIQLRQLVASGKQVNADRFYTAREDVQRFITRIWLPATTGAGRRRLRPFFHDNHFERGFEEAVYFPPNGLTLERDVDLHGVWRVDLQMVSLEKYPYDDIKVQQTPVRTGGGRRYVVRRGDTLERIARRLAGAHASAARVHQVREEILNLNPSLRQRRRLPDGRTGKPQRVYPGELIRLP